jgi:hypothetical protein
VEELDRWQSALLSAVTASDLVHLLADLPGRDRRESAVTRARSTRRVIEDLTDKAARVVDLLSNAQRAINQPTNRARSLHTV